MAQSSSFASNVTPENAIPKPRLGFWEIWNMNFGFLGIQFGFALQNANVSRIFQTLGAEVDEIAILWIAAPATGLLVQPIIGYLSDHTWSARWGRRKPFFMIGAILASIALIFMPNSSELWMAAGMLWILDASINISMEPFRALIGDMMPESQRTVGFATQSFFIGVGAVIASALPYILTNFLGFSNEAPEGKIPDTVIWSFYSGSAVFFLAVMWTVFNTKEYSPEELAKYHGEEEVDNSEAKKSLKEILLEIMKDIAKMPKTMAQLAVVQFFSWLALFAMWIYTTSAVTSHTYDMKLDKTSFEGIKASVMAINVKDENTAAGKKEAKELKKAKEILTKLETKFKTQQEISTDLGIVMYALNGKILDENKLIDKLGGLPIDADSEEAKKAKDKMQELKDKKSKSIPVQLDAETADFFANTTTIDLKMPEDEQAKLKLFAKLKNIQKEYNQGADWVGIMFAVYSGLSAVFAFLFPPFADATSRKTAHMVGLTMGGLGLISIYFMPSPEMLLLSMVGVGFAWASILTMPYAILAGCLPANKMGFYMGVFNFFIVLPQLIAAAFLGWFTSVFFDGQAVYTLMLGGFCMIIAAALVVFVDDKTT